MDLRNSRKSSKNLRTSFRETFEKALFGRVGDRKASRRNSNSPNVQMDDIYSTGKNIGSPEYSNYNLPSQATANWYSPPYSYELRSTEYKKILRSPSSRSPDFSTSFRGIPKSSINGKIRTYFQ
jgi:hypothetical protein